MKISYRTYPILKKLEAGRLDGFAVVSKEDADRINLIEDKVYKNFSDNCDKFKENIWLVSWNFYDSCLKCSDKLATTDIISQVIASGKNGTFLIGAMSVCFLIHKNTLFAYIFSKVKNDDEVGLAGIGKIELKEDGSLETGAFFLSSSARNLKYDTEGETMYNILQQVIMLQAFMKYCKVETNYIKADSKSNILGEKIVNDTKTGMTHLDSNWFTTIVRTEGFMVSEHLRWQPKKVNGEWTRELIYIAPFQKHGYTRQATKIKEGLTEEVV